MESTWMVFLADCIKWITLIFSVIAIIGYSYDLFLHGRRQHLIGWFASAGFVVLTFLISMRLIFLHLTHWHIPDVQKYVVRIIWMLPIYSVESWLALRFRTLALYIETARECYEAYVIFNFMYFLIALLGNEGHISSMIKARNRERINHSFPCNLFFKPWTMGQEVLYKCKFGVLQYVVVKNVMAITVFILAHVNQYEEGQFRYNRGYGYVCIINSISQLWALYCLALFYSVTKEELHPYKPFGKFLCVKLVVFFTWWQSILITLAVNNSHYEENSQDSWTSDEVSKGIQDFIICIEMFFASLAFSVTFTHKEYVNKIKMNTESQLRPNKSSSDERMSNMKIEKNTFFFTAFLQSSLPNEIIEDLRKVAGGHSFFNNYELMDDTESLADDNSIDLDLMGVQLSDNVEEPKESKNTLSIALSPPMPMGVSIDTMADVLSNSNMSSKAKSPKVASGTLSRSGSRSVDLVGYSTSLVNESHPLENITPSPRISNIGKFSPHGSPKFAPAT